MALKLHKTPPSYDLYTDFSLFFASCSNLKSLKLSSCFLYYLWLALTLKVTRLLLRRSQYCQAANRLHLNSLGLKTLKQLRMRSEILWLRSDELDCTSVSGKKKKKTCSDTNLHSPCCWFVVGSVSQTYWTVPRLTNHYHTNIMISIISVIAPHHHWVIRLQ